MVKGSEVFNEYRYGRQELSTGQECVDLFQESIPTNVGSNL
jgi:hypothetical protein